MSDDNDLVCSCCGHGVSKKDNVWLHAVPYPGDLGTGLCRACGGDPDAKDIRKLLGFAMTTFVDARIPLVAALLSEQNRPRFLALPYEEQVNFVLYCVRRGFLT